MNNVMAKMKKSAQTRMALLILAVICGIITIAIFGTWVADKINLATNGEPDFTQLSLDEMKNGLFITGTIKEAIGPYAEQYTIDEHGNESPESLNQFYYLIPIYSKQGDYIECFVTFEASYHLSDKNVMEHIAEDSASGVNTGELVIEHGRMVKMKKEQKRILQNWLISEDFYEGGSFIDYCVEYNVMGTTDRDVIYSKIMTYNIDREWQAGRIDIQYILLPLALGVFFVLWIILIDGVQKKRRAKQKADKARQITNINTDEDITRFY
jgi:hypothetical protein